ncbi:peptidoglycan-binding protein [Streptosporangium sandarakinum]
MDLVSLTAAALIDVAKSYVGYREENDATKFGQWWDRTHKTSGYAKAAWCDMFVSYCAQEAAGADGKNIVGEFAYTPWHAAWFARNGRFGNDPKKGAIVFFDWSGTKNISAIDHVGIVIGVDARGRVVTVEGNTADQVAIRYRDRSTIVGYGYPKYAKAATPAKVPPTPSRTPQTKPAQAPKFPLPRTDWFGWGPSAHAHAIGSGVRKIQTRLVAHGHKIDIDGVFGPETAAAVKTFQKAHGLKVDGAVGPDTWPKLWTAAKK